MSRLSALVRFGVAPAIAVVMLALSAATALAIDGTLDVKVDTWAAGGGRAYVGVKAEGRWARPGTPLLHRLLLDLGPPGHHLHRPRPGPVGGEGPHLLGQHREPAQPDHGAHEPGDARHRRPPIDVRRADPGPRRRRGSRDRPGGHDPDRHRRPHQRLARGRRRPHPGHDRARVRADPALDRRLRRRHRAARSPRHRPTRTGSRPPTPTAPVSSRSPSPRGSRVARTPRSSRPTAPPTSPPLAGPSTSPTPRRACRACRSSTSPRSSPSPASPTGTLPDGTTAAADPDGLTAIWWPRGLPCDLVRARGRRARGVHALGRRGHRAGPDPPRQLPLHQGHQRRHRRHPHGHVPRRASRSGSSGTPRCPGRGPTRSASRSRSRPPTTTAPSGPPAWRARWR